MFWGHLGHMTENGSSQQADTQTLGKLKFLGLRNQVGAYTFWGQLLSLLMSVYVDPNDALGGVLDAEESA